MMQNEKWKHFEFSCRTDLGICRDDDSETIATVHDYGDAGRTLDVAKLIAAAPELLAALIDAQRSLAHFVDSAVIPDTTVMQAYAQAKLAEAKARAALAKAT
jgi:hypothetical protein